MSYQAFSLKWRPQDFAQVVGQEHVVTTLKNAILKNRLVHAYLFAGPRGVGKTSIARIFAKALNCVNGPTLTPCQKCSSCQEITQGRSLDVLEIDGASNRGIDEIRQLRENVKFAPSQGRYKIYIIDEVHMLTPEAFNALLKTLEEPPEFVKFIFATTHPHKIIPTILSRCQRFDFSRITNLKIVEQLEKIIAQEKIDIDKEILFSIAQAADGSLRDAESILDQLVSFSAGKISKSDINALLGIIEQEQLFALSQSIIQKDADAALKLFNQMIDQGKDIQVFLLNFIEHFRNLMIAKISRPEAGLIDLPKEYLSKIMEQAEFFSLEELFSIFNLLVNTQETCKRFGAMRIPIEIALVKLCQEKRKKENLVWPQANPRSQTNPHNLAKPQPPENSGGRQKEESPAKNLEEILELWPRFIEQLGTLKMSLASFLSQAQPLKWEKGTLSVGFHQNDVFHKETLEKKENRLLVENLFSQLMQSPVKFNFVLSAQVNNHQKDAASTPKIQQAMDAFGARLIKED